MAAATWGNIAWEPPSTSTARCDWATSGQVQVILDKVDSQTCRDALGEFQFSAGLAQLLLGQPTTGDQPSSQAGRLNDEALVKLFRIIRLARRLVDLELPPATSEQAATDQ